MSKFKLNVDVDKPFPQFRNYAEYKREAEKVVDAFDKNNDGAIGRDEANQVVLFDSGTATKTIRADEYRREQKIPYNRYASFKPGVFDRVNNAIGKDGLVTANDLLHHYDRTKDKDGNDQLNLLESWTMSPKEMGKEMLNFSYEFPTEKKRP